MNFMNEAIQEAYNGIKHKHGGPFGSIIVKDGQIVGRGHNMVIANHDPTAHGEVMAIRNACENLKTHDLTGCTLYTTAEPCPMCLGAILWANINKVYFGCNINDTNDIGFRDERFYKYLQEKDTSVLEITEHERKACLELFKDYKNQEHTLY